MNNTVSIKKENFYGWDGFRLNNHFLSLGLAPQIGGRIISLRCGEIELLFVQDEHKGETYDFLDIQDLAAEKRKMGFRLWGGDKTWVAPQDKWVEKIPPLELDAGQYQSKIKANGIVMTSPVCQETGIQIVREVTLNDDNSIILNQSFYNKSDQTIDRGIWDVTQLLRPFEIYIQAKKENIRAYKDEGLIEEARHKISEHKNWVKIQCNNSTHFKFGGMIEHGVVLALRHLYTDKEKQEGITIAFVRFFDIDPEVSYAHDAMVEVYNSPKYDYLEVEVHAPFKRLKPGEAHTHQQIWRIAKIDKIVNPEEALNFLKATSA